MACLGGNHGGSSYEETDSLALFIGLKNDVSDYLLSTHNNVHQVDIAPTLALLLGVPIPKNMLCPDSRNFCVFEWYIYVCATTVCVYIGVSVVAATVTYICIFGAGVEGIKKQYKLCHQQ